jgi:hypothetical protein
MAAGNGHFHSNAVVGSYQFGFNYALNAANNGPFLSCLHEDETSAYIRRHKCSSLQLARI